MCWVAWCLKWETDVVVFTESVYYVKCRKHRFARIGRASFGKTSNCPFPWQGMGEPTMWKPWRELRHSLWMLWICQPRATGGAHCPTLPFWTFSCECLRSAPPWFWLGRTGRLGLRGGGGLLRCLPEGNRTAGGKPRTQRGRRESRESGGQSSPPRRTGRWLLLKAFCLLSFVLPQESAFSSDWCREISWNEHEKWEKSVHLLGICFQL